MKYGFGVPTRGPMANPRDITAMAKKGEELGFDVVFVNDHIVVPRDVGSRYPYSDSGEWPGGASGEAMEQLVLLSYLASATSRMRLLTSVMVVPHRNPVTTAKMLATIDVLSEGRVAVGCGTGWMREEFEAIGTDPYAERGAVTDEYLRVFKTLWTEENPEFAGKYAKFSNITFLPKPVQAPHPPLWIGGESGRAHRRVAALGDCWYPIGNNPRQSLDSVAKYAAGIEALNRALDAVGRDPASIDLSYGANWYGDGSRQVSADGSRMAFTGEAGEIAADIAGFEAKGLRSIMLNFQGSSLSQTLDRMEHFMRDIAPAE
ncbi:MAG: LLM class F420-dependent oxidoreductase [Proteobacteria bacterium]|jgi:probable F420-dependent oxidoreductase|nr:LLM class F420-dependent oxidoreductase [Pseudomonadota bacterium]